MIFQRFAMGNFGGTAGKEEELFQPMAFFRNASMR